jgi:hypothetical protein
MIVYLLRSKVTGKCYVGKTSQPFAARLRQHRTEARISRYQWPLYLAMRADGWGSFTSSILFESDSTEAIRQFECQAIQDYCAMEPLGYNQDGCSRGGPDTKPQRVSLGRPLGRQHRERIRESVQRYHAARKQQEAEQEQEQEAPAATDQQTQSVTRGGK